VSNDDFRRELNNVFDNVSGAPSSNLPDRVRSAVVQAPEARGPYWLAGVAAVLIAVVTVGVLYIAGPLKPPSSVGGVHPGPTPIPSPTVSSSPDSNPTPPAKSQQFTCTDGSVIADGGSGQPPVIFISGLRTGTHPGYDRLTIDLANGTPPEVTFKTATGTTFTLSPSGMTAKLKGTNSIKVVIQGADLHTSYSGPTDIVTGYKGLAEVRRVEDFEGVVQLGLGVNGLACYRYFYLSNPNRLVIDIQTS
jgi:hypothetical protein